MLQPLFLGREVVVRAEQVPVRRLDVEQLLVNDAVELSPLLLGTNPGNQNPFGASPGRAEALNQLAAGVVRQQLVNFDPERLQQRLLEHELDARRVGSHERDERRVRRRLGELGVLRAKHDPGHAARGQRLGDRTAERGAITVREALLQSQRRGVVLVPRHAGDPAGVELRQRPLDFCQTDRGVHFEGLNAVRTRRTPSGELRKLQVRVTGVQRRPAAVTLLDRQSNRLLQCQVHRGPVRIEDRGRCCDRLHVGRDDGRVWLGFELG